MLANRPILVGAVFSVQLLSVLRKRLIIGQFSAFLCYSLVPMRGVDLLKQTETDLIAGSG